MSAMTPTQKGSMLAGIGIWILAWATLMKIDKIPLLSRFVGKERIFNWVSRNRAVSLLFTEIFNFAVHGISKPESVLFALGGTVVNTTMIFGIIPFRQSRRQRIHGRELLKSRAA